MRRKLTTMEMAYIARFVPCDGVYEVSRQLDRRPCVVNEVVRQLERDGEWEHWQEIWNRGDINA